MPRYNVGNRIIDANSLEEAQAKARVGSNLNNPEQLASRIQLMEQQLNDALANEPGDTAKITRLRREIQRMREESGAPDGTGGGGGVALSEVLERLRRGKANGGIDEAEARQILARMGQSPDWIERNVRDIENARATAAGGGPAGGTGGSGGEDSVARLKALQEAEQRRVAEQTGGLAEGALGAEQGRRSAYADFIRRGLSPETSGFARSFYETQRPVAEQTFFLRNLAGEDLPSFESSLNQGGLGGVRPGRQQFLDLLRRGANTFGSTDLNDAQRRGREFFEDPQDQLQLALTSQMLGIDPSFRPGLQRFGRRRFDEFMAQNPESEFLPEFARRGYRF